MIDATDIQRLHLGHYTMPPPEPSDSGDEPRDPRRMSLMTYLAGRQIVITGFLIRHPRGLFLFDTGLGKTENETTRHLGTVRRDVLEALARKGVAPEDVSVIANCHLHFDHGGGNFNFRGTTILAQRSEMEAAHQEGHTFPEDVIDFPEATFEEIDGDADPLPGIKVIPTPGHTAGHQSLVVETKQGRVILAGQAQDFTSDYAMAAFSRELALRGERHADYPAWMDRFAELDPWRVLFAHDYAVWENPSV